jgi:DNA-binding response OmpR family regulator
MKTRVLVVEDDRALGRVLSDNLVFDGHEVEWVTEGRAAAEALRHRGANLILLDIGLPDTDGFRLLELLRGAGETPIIVLTARGQRADKLQGLRLGADDYVTKPFDVEELLARVKTVLRRSTAAVERLTLGDVEIDFAARAATRAGQPVHLTDKEIEILRYLAVNHARIVHRDELLRAVWGYQDAPLTRSVDHAIARLRKKIEPGHGAPRFIQTVHGDGYRLVV